ncbi:MAG: DUF2807 domain-containing protein [Bacteroidia bacterium]|nr:DUF2807 domain-containing protein [Bacteroidia bacterium]
MNFKKNVIIFIISVLNFSCMKEQLNDCFQSTGADISITKQLNSFSKINIGENFNIILKQDTSQNEHIKITGGKNIISQIVTNVKNGTLSVKNRNTCNFVRSYKRKITLEIYVKYLDEIILTSVAELNTPDTLYFENRTIKIKNLGLGDVKINIKSGFLDIQSINSGSLTLSGFSNIMSCSIEEVSSFDALNLLCDDIYIDCHSPLNCYVFPKIKLYAKLFNSGNVFYRNGSDDLKTYLVEKRGSGSLLKL